MPLHAVGMQEKQAARWAFLDHRVPSQPPVIHHAGRAHGDGDGGPGSAKDCHGQRHGFFVTLNREGSGKKGTETAS